MHFILQAGERGSIAVRVELVVQLKSCATVLRTRERLKMPCAFPKKLRAHDLQAQFGITQLATSAQIPEFAGVQRRCCLARAGGL